MVGQLISDVAAADRTDRASAFSTWQALAVSSLLSPGFLVAAPSLLDPNFHRGLVLLVEHSDEGSLGFVINRPSDVDRDAIADGLELTPAEVKGEMEVLVGGPVAPETGWIVFDPTGIDTLPDGTIEVAARIAVSTSRTFLMRLLCAELEPRQMLALGYAGWAPGQLDDEVSQGAWIPVDLDERVVFETACDGRWAAALLSAGIEPGRLSAHAPSEA
jgi:putative transcriptional regulator